MNELRWTELAAHVVAWHNRHPLARRIGVQHVQSLGYVMLPFSSAAPPAAPAAAHTRATPDGPQPLPPEAVTGSLRERAMARAQMDAHQHGQTQGQTPSHAEAHSGGAPAAVQPAFDEDFIPPHAPRAVRRWAARHAVAQATPRGDVQVRKVAATAGLGDNEVLPRWVLTAQIEFGTARTRVLVGAGSQPAVLGRRLFSPTRGLALLALPLAAAGAVAWMLSRPPAPPAPVLAKVPVAPASAASPALPPRAATAATATSEPLRAGVPAMPALASAPASAPAAPSTSTPASAATAAIPAASTPASAAPAIARPADVEPRLGKIDLPSLGPVIDERRRRAQAAAASAAGPAAASATHAASAGMAAPRPAAAAVPAPAAAPPPHAGPSFAVSTRLLRTRSESEQVAAAMRELLTRQSGTAVRVEVLPVGDDWRVVGWPYADRALADKAQALLASRGMKVQVIDF